jgi:hypothetical protein
MAKAVATWLHLGASPAEKFPRAVMITEASVRSQFACQLRRTAIEDDAAKDNQVALFLADSGRFVAITHSGSYVRLAPRSWNWAYRERCAAICRRRWFGILVDSQDNTCFVVTGQ